MNNEIDTYGQSLAAYLQADKYGLFSQEASYENLIENQQPYVHVTSSNVQFAEQGNCEKLIISYQIFLYTAQIFESKHLQKLIQIFRKLRNFNTDSPAIYATDGIIQQYIYWEGQKNSLVLKTGFSVKIHEK